MANGNPSGKKTFRVSLLNSWKSGVSGVIDGTRTYPKRAAAVGDIDPSKVIGRILVLRPSTETENLASGTLAYTYNLQLPSSAPATDPESQFKITWTADPKVITDINELNANNLGAQSVIFYNLQGQCSDIPFEGVNIVVTRYSDGTTETSKVVR